MDKLTKDERIRVVAALILSGEWILAAKADTPEIFIKAAGYADLHDKHFDDLHKALQTAMADKIIAAEDASRAIPADLRQDSKPLEKPAEEKLHWTKRPENKAKVRAAARKMMKTRKKNGNWPNNARQ